MNGEAASRSRGEEPHPHTAPHELHRDTLERVRAVCRERGIDAGWDVGRTLRATQELRLQPGGADRGRQQPTDGLVHETADERLELGDSVAKGGMGWVRRALQRSLAREVAVKSSLPDLLSDSVRAALLDEARIAGRLEHPNIVPIHDLVTTQSGPMIVMKHIEGASWHDLIEDDDHPLWNGEQARLERHLEIMLDLCQAVHFAHSRGVVHGDIKPANVMVGAYGEVYLLDWGVAAEVGTYRCGIGTPAYMAPELVHGAQPVGVHTDVYLLGATLHHVLTAVPRHTGNGVEEVLQAALQSRPCVYAETVPTELGEICNRACSADPATRFADALALRQALQGYLAHRSSVRTSSRATAALADLKALAATGARDEQANLKAHRLYSAARHGFDQALDEWPDNREAWQGRRVALESMAKWELDRGNSAGAETFIAELDSTPPEIEDHLAAVRAAQSRQARAQAQLAELRNNLRLRGHDRGRSIATLLNGAFSVAGTLTLAAAIRAGSIDAGVVTHPLFAVAITVVAAVGMFAMRRSLFDNLAYLRLMTVLALLGPLMLLNRFIGVLQPRSFHEVITGDCLIFVTIAVVLVAGFGRAFWLSVAIAVAGTLAVQIWPAYAIELIGVAYGLNSVRLAWVVRPLPGEDAAPGAGIQRAS